MNDPLISGLDYASGVNGFPGTPTDSQDLLINTPDGSTDVFEEDPTSPEIERSEQATFQHTFTFDRERANAIITSYGRGSILTDSFGNVTRILSVRASQMKGGLTRISVTAEAISFDPPPDQFSCDTVEVNPDAEKHPRYKMLTYKEKYLIRNAVISDDLDIKEQCNSIVDQIVDVTHKAAAKELLLKKHRGEENFYLPGFRITWSQFFWQPVYLDPGGYIQDPITEGGLPYFFWSTDGSETGGSIFDFAASLNPNMYANGISWLRKSDAYSYERTWFKKTRIWEGAPLGHWDNEWYNKVAQSYQVTDTAAAP